LAHPHNAGALPQPYVGDAQTRHFSYAQASLQHHLQKLVIALAQPVLRLTGGAQQTMGLRLGESGGTNPANRTG
jgi:hypothetical protein